MTYINRITELWNIRPGDKHCCDTNTSVCSLPISLITDRPLIEGEDFLAGGDNNPYYEFLKELPGASIIEFSAGDRQKKASIIEIVGSRL